MPGSKEPVAVNYPFEQTGAAWMAEFACTHCMHAWEAKVRVKFSIEVRNFLHLLKVEDSEEGTSVHCHYIARVNQGLYTSMSLHKNQASNECINMQ